jgi:hypothetical protein
MRSKAAIVFSMASLPGAGPRQQRDPDLPRSSPDRAGKIKSSVARAQLSPP